MKLFRHCLALVFLSAPLISISAWAIPEKDYPRNFDSTVMPFYQNAGVSGEFAGVNGVKISYRKFDVPGEKGVIVFSPGRGESYLTYPELEYDLVQAGFSVYVIDHRSQGYSGRIAPNPQVVTVESFDNYVTDFTTFVDTIVNAAPHAHRFLLTNSMGGTIGALYLAKHPTTFERAVLSVPMFEINTHGIWEPAGLELAKLETLLGHGDRFAKLGGEKPYDFSAQTDCSSADGHVVRRCEIANLVRANPATASGGSSYRWVVQSLETTRQIRKGLGTQVTIPVLIFQAGRDQIVLPGGQNTFCQQAPHCTKTVFPTASHEVLTESDEIRAPAVLSIIDFFAQ